jgi:small subunit ribosomal protein S7
MPRRGGAPKHDVLSDPIYHSTVVTKLINQIMLDGKKGTAQRICYDAFDIIKEKLNLEPLEVFEKAMENIMPVLEVKARRVGGATYQVRSRSVRRDGRLWGSGGWSQIQAKETKERPSSGWLPRSWTPTPAPAAA